MLESACLISSTASVGFSPTNFKVTCSDSGTDPAGVRREPAHTFHEALNALADGVVDVEGDENAHNRAIGVSHVVPLAQPFGGRGQHGEELND